MSGFGSGGFRDAGPTADDVTAAIASRLTLPAWQPLPLAAGITPWSATDFPPPQYLLDPEGFAHLTGLCILPTVTQPGRLTLATLPAGARPDLAAAYAVLGDGAPARVDVYPTGAVQLVQFGSGTSYLSFGHLVWRVGG